ncbi:hypothetical protein BGY98DRAFT_959276 [Russula aff. rugulosa BPL654]|nr:hypothetical protein BGY98DRAFT_959276 [Russula aff. rugulosa BPL654]
MNTTIMHFQSPSSCMDVKSPMAYYDREFLRLWEASYPECNLKVYLKDNSASPASESESPRTTSRPGITRGDQFTGTPTPKPETHSESGVIFTSGLIRATGDHVSVREFCKARGLAPTLHLVIPSDASDSAAVAPTGATNDVEETFRPPPIVPSFSLTLPSPTATPPSPIHYPSSVQRTFTRLSYYKEVDRAPRHMRIPHLPQYCAHTLRPFVPLTKCALCEIQIFACETWWNSRNPKHNAGLKRLLCAPQVLPADCTATTRSIYYALGLPLGDLDESCIDWDVVDTIMFMPSRPPRRYLGCQLPAAAFGESSRIRVLFRRARRFFSTL